MFIAQVAKLFGELRESAMSWYRTGSGSDRVAPCPEYAGWIAVTTRSHPPPQAGCPPGDPGPLPVLYRLLCLVLIGGFLAIAICNTHRTAHATNEADGTKQAVDEKAALIDQALFARAEFFGAQALVPYPTAEARTRLAALQAKYPADAEIDLKLSQLDEKLGREADALKEMRSFVEHEPDQVQALETMAAFAHRRAQFPAEAEALEKMLLVAPQDERAEIFRRLTELAQVHLLEKYLAPAFYEQTLTQNPELFEVFEQYLDKLSETKDAAEALKVLRAYKDRFPERRSSLIKREASMLEAMGREKEAEAVYVKAFDPFWPGELSDSFYGFLREHDRYRAYGTELREAFRRDPTNFDMAVRLIDYGNRTRDEGADVIFRLEKARAQSHIAWKPPELVAITRFLLAGGHGDAASRFLYTLSLQGELKPGSELRAGVLYQIFEILSDSGDKRLSLTRGDLKFYQDIATADPHPGMLGGILSLVLSDTDPRAEFQRKEEQAVHHFNRAAAFRVFGEYKREYPTAPELAQMYLDIVRLYAATGEPAIAAQTLAEFEQRYTDAPQYPEIALKLADCYVALGKVEEERRLYQHLLDYLGQHRKQGQRLVPSTAEPQTIAERSSQGIQGLDITAEPTSVAPQILKYPFASNTGIHVPGSADAGNSEYSKYGYTAETYPDYLAGHTRSSKSAKKEVTDSSSVAYADVLARYVASLNKDNRASDILALYANEIKKYGEEQGLYEQLLQWLGQTNMVDEQLRLYQETIKKFPTTTWHDRLARWFLKRQKNQEFEAFSRDLLERLDDDEVERYLHTFVDSGAGANAASFDAGLYVALYTRAHQRFPHNLTFVNGLLNFYSAHNDWPKWRGLVAEYYFVSRDIRDKFLLHLASHGELRASFERARDTLAHNSTGPVFQSLPYKLFRADAAVWLSNYEEAVAAYRELNTLYPNTVEFAERLIAFTRSLGQHNRKSLEESATLAHAQAESLPSEAAYRTRAGELQAELGDYQRARGEWEQLIALGRGRPETYLDTATVYWDYFQYDEALRTIKALRGQRNDESLYAFQMGAIFESKHQLPLAIAEYVSAMSSSGSESSGDESRAKARLLKLSKRPGLSAQISLAYTQERRHAPNNTALVLAYVDFLSDAKRWDEGAPLLRTEVARSTAQEFLKQARSTFVANDDSAGEVAALKRLVLVTSGPRLSISYRLQLAESLDGAHESQAAALVLRQLVQKFPTNYGVLTETADFYWRLGRHRDSLNVLQLGRQRGIGRFHYLFGRKLAAREIELKQFAAAAQVLGKLHDEDPLNTEVFHELAKLYVARGNREALRASFRVTLAAIKHQDIDLAGIRSQVAEVRGQVIDAFTRLKDYGPAVEQHIEIINREPENEERLDAAINYVKRYGGADTLLNYYQKTSAQAYKNYRWNVVLARIYEAKGDLLNAARQYRAALVNQPEMLELYDGLAAIYTRAKDYDSALETLKKVTELSNDDPQYLKRTIEVLEKAGRQREAELLRQKLPHEQPQKLSVSNQFAEAARLRGSERKRAVATYREAFDAFSAEPFKHDLQGSEITGYVQAVRDEESLDQILRRLWELRARMVLEAERVDNLSAGKAGAILATLDGAVPEAVGGLAAEKATGDELSGLFDFLKQQIDASLQKSGDKTATLACLQNLSRRAGFGLLEEQILVGQKDLARSLSDRPAYHNRLRTLIDFYGERGNYGRVIELLTAERAKDASSDQFDYAQLLAENARLVGDNERELQALREIYQRPPSPGAPAIAAYDAQVERYFDALSERADAGRSELLTCAEQPNRHQLQLINFLLRQGDKELAQTAIENARLSLAWKLSRHAEASLSLGEFAAASENYFLAALQFRSIGELIAQKPDTTKQLVGDDWFRLTQTYGRWLYAANGPGQLTKSRALLPAMIENRPEDSNEQARLGRWYLEQKDAPHAIEHLRLAHEAKPADTQILADLGAAHFAQGDRTGAEELWEEIVSDKPSLENCQVYLNTLVKLGLADVARQRLTPILTDRLNQSVGDESEYESNEVKKEREQLRGLIRAVAKSFERYRTGSGSDRVSTPAKVRPTSPEDPVATAPGSVPQAAFFRKLVEAAPSNYLLPELLIKESLLAREQRGPFYQLLIERSAGLTRYDFDSAYVAQLQKSWNAASAEEALDQENNYRRSEPDCLKIDWQKQYLQYLIERKQTSEARALIAAIESAITRRYARPIWLRLAALRLDIRGGRLGPAYDSLARLAGIQTSANLKTINAPSLERLNDAAQLLREEGHEANATALFEAAYARDLALEQYQPAYLVGLATIAFERGDAPAGLKWLQALVSLSKADTKAETEGELASLPTIKKYVVDAPGVELPKANNAIEEKKALQVAAETAGRFAQFAVATTYRKLLLTASPDDEENRLELARLLSADKQPAEAIEALAAIIGDRNATRNLRWQAVWLAAEITEQKPAAWATLRDRVRSLNASDGEMATALEALALSASGRTGEGVKLLVDSEVKSPNPNLRILQASLERNSGHDGDALTAYLQALIEINDASARVAFGFVEDQPLDQVVRLYLKQGQPRAALKIAERLINLQPQTTTDKPGNRERELEMNGPVSTSERYQTLRTRAELRERGARIELLEFLSVAAERTGDLNRAITLEQTRLALLVKASDRQATESRLEQLREAQKKAERQRKPALVVDQRLVAGA